MIGDRCGVWVIDVGLWRSAGGFFLGDRFGVWVIGVGLWCLVFDGLSFFFFFGVHGRLWVGGGGGGGVKCV